jgi:hypothetical protein
LFEDSWVIPGLSRSVLDASPRIFFEQESPS